jgi:hypothetical protein
MCSARALRRFHARQLVSAPTRVRIEGDSARARTASAPKVRTAVNRKGLDLARPTRSDRALLHRCCISRFAFLLLVACTRMLAYATAAPAPGRGTGGTAPRPTTPRAAQRPRPAVEGWPQSKAPPSAPEEHFRHASQKYSSWSAVEEGALDGHGASCVHAYTCRPSPARIVVDVHGWSGRACAQITYMSWAVSQRA